MNHPDFLFGLTHGDYSYDIECFPNFFCIGITCRRTKKRWYFEISFRRNDIEMLCLFLEVLRRLKCRMIGFNNLGYDYPVVHFIYQNSTACITYRDIYYKSKSIIDAEFNARFAHMVWESEWVVEQVDLYKIHHFDNVSKATSLKALEICMQMDTVEESPIPFDTELTSDQADEIVSYMWHDIGATDMFADRTGDHIKLREELSQTFDKNMINMSDVKIGETILVHELEARGIECHQWVDGKKTKKKTVRNCIDLNEVIFPYVNFERVEFQNIKSYFQSKVITETKGVFKGLVATVDGLDYTFGTGGLHASVETAIFKSNETHQIVDVDVASFYPNLGIKNKLFPAHLGPEFCVAYEGVYNTRSTYKKGTPRNEAYKLALNGAYGNSNNEYSSFFDPQYTMSITINGQLLLCMLVEQLIKVPGLRMIQANTDGVTYYCPREYLDHTRAVCHWWEQLTQLTLEEVLYKRMWVRDVNSYMAEKEDGKLKRIGAYAYVTAEENPGTRELPYHKDWSARVVAKAAEAALVRGEDIREFITEMHCGKKFSQLNLHDYFLRAKVPKSSKLFWGDKQVGNIARYYVATTGYPLEKVMPTNMPEGAYKRANKLTDEYYFGVIHELTGLNPRMEAIDWSNVPWDERINTKNKSKYETTRDTGICTGWNVQLANDLRGYEENDVWDQLWDSINYEWYIKEAEKLVKPLLTVS